MLDYLDNLMNIKFIECKWDTFGIQRMLIYGFIPHGFMSRIHGLRDGIVVGLEIEGYNICQF